MDELNLIFANKLQELRKERNVKQEIVARELKISQQAYSKLERGDLNFNSIILKKICLFFNIPIATFLNTGSSVKILNSPQGNMQNSVNNDTHFVNELLKAKDETIITLRDLLNTQKELLQTKETIISNLKKK